MRALLILAALLLAACDGPICVPALSSPRDCAPTSEPAG